VCMSVCVCVCVCVALVIQHAMGMLHLWPPPTLQYFSVLLDKRHDFRKNVTEHTMYLFIFPTTFVRNISHSKKK